jgi:hypothetical protein
VRRWPWQSRKKRESSSEYCSTGGEWWMQSYGGSQQQPAPPTCRFAVALAGSEERGRLLLVLRPAGRA